MPLRHEDADQHRWEPTICARCEEPIPPDAGLALLSAQTIHKSTPWLRSITGEDEFLDWDQRLPVCLDCYNADRHRCDLRQRGWCEACGRLVLWDGRSRSKHTFCSGRCRSRGLSRQYRARNRRTITVTCRNCSETFTPKRDDAKYCSTRCRVAWYRRVGQRENRVEAQVQELLRSGRRVGSVVRELGLSRHYVESVASRLERNG